MIQKRVLADPLVDKVPFSTHAKILAMTSLVFWHAAINMLMVTRMAPVVGVPLPLFSYGGSFVVTIKDREKFKEATGTNFVKYVARTRFEKAQALLRNADLRISEIAFACGFQSLSQFNRVFKKLSGKSPTQFRAERGRPGWT